jgi:RNA polymerase subunit RPABC4/transcription elongation factor Spt4
MEKYKYGDKIKCAYVACDNHFEYEGTTRAYCSTRCQFKAEQLKGLIKRRTQPKKIILCKNCNKTFPKKYQFCPYCSAKLEVQVITKSQEEIQEITEKYINRAIELSKNSNNGIIEIDEGIFL